jgi:molecular chaperone DnaK (HSP70)
VVLDAAYIAGIKVLKLLNSTTAAAIAYSVFQRARTVENAVPVAIVDFGDSAMNVAVVRLWANSLEVKGFWCDERLGGSHFTTALVDWLLEKTRAKYRIDPRALLRFRQAAERLKKGLAVNPVMPFEVQNLLDADVNFLVKRDEFKATRGDLLARIRAPVERALELAGVAKEALFAIEEHGGASRIPAVKASSKRFSGGNRRRPSTPTNASRSAQGSRRQFCRHNTGSTSI